MLPISKFPRLGVLVLFLLGISALLPGCGSTYRATQLSRTPLEDEVKVVYKDMSLKSNLAVMNIVQDDVNGMLRVRGKVKNTGHGTVNAEVKVKFIDKDGMEIGQGAPWMPLPVEGGEIRTFESLAASTLAVNWRILIQLASSH